MTISVTIHRPTVMTSKTSEGTSWVKIKAEGGDAAFFAPRHVCEATAAAFSRAMQVTQKDSSLYYANDAGLWAIYNGFDYGWRAQHDEITGDGDPAWMFAEAGSLEALQDALDDIAAERAEEVA